MFIPFVYAVPKYMRSNPSKKEAKLGDTIPLMTTSS